MTAAERERALRRALLAPGGYVGEAGLRLRPFSLWTLDACREMGLTYFLGSEDAPSTLSERRHQVAALAWAHWEQTPEPAIDRAIVAGTWPDAVRAFTVRPEVGADLPAFLEYVDAIALGVMAATVRVIPKPSEQKADSGADTPPGDLVEPLSGAAITWTLAGGQLLGEAETRWLYRGLSLPVALQYYHCALAAADRWTVPVGEASPQAAVAAVASARVIADTVARQRAAASHQALF